MGQSQQVIKDQSTQETAALVSLNHSPITPNLAAAAKRFGLRSQALDRHSAFLESQQNQELRSLQQERDASRAKYDALKQTVDQLVTVLKDMASDPQQAQAKDIQNIRVLLKHAIQAMERQQVELKGIRARTQRMERAALKTESLQADVSAMNTEISGYQKALHSIRADMADLVSVIEGDGGLKDLASQIDTVRDDVKETQNRTSMLEEKSTTQTARINDLEIEVQQLRRMVATSMQETSGLSGTVISLRKDVSQLRKKIGHYIIDQMRFARRT